MARKVRISGGVYAFFALVFAAFFGSVVALANLVGAVDLDRMFERSYTPPAMQGYARNNYPPPADKSGPGSSFYSWSIIRFFNIKWGKDGAEVEELGTVGCSFPYC